MAYSNIFNSREEKRSEKTASLFEVKDSSIEVQAFPVNPLGTNCYVVNDETKEAVIIDCGCFAESEWNRICSYIAERDLKVVHLLNTHLHFDHAFGNHFPAELYGINPKAHDGDLALYEHMSDSITRLFGIRMQCPECPPLDRELSDGDTLLFGTHKIQVLHTPGHTAGCVCFYIESEDTLFSGDTLFARSVGRTDFPESTPEDLVKSLRNKLLPLPDNTTVYPGHGESTTIGEERKFNPYF